MINKSPDYTPRFSCGVEGCTAMFASMRKCRRHRAEVHNVTGFLTCKHCGQPRKTIRHKCIQPKGKRDSPYILSTIKEKKPRERAVYGAQRVIRIAVDDVIVSNTYERWLELARAKELPKIFDEQDRRAVELFRTEHLIN